MLALTLITPCLLGGCTLSAAPASDADCTPGELSCVGNVAYICAAGSRQFLRDCTDDAMLCDASEVCVPQNLDPCEVARETRSYLGCEYYAVSTPNPLLDRREFRFGIVVANAGNEPTTVQVTRGENRIVERTIAARDVATIELPWIEEIASMTFGSTLLHDGSYHIVSDRPVAAYQYSPLTYRREPQCERTADPLDRGCFSFTNDASLLLPVAALDSNYMVDVIAHTGDMYPSFVAVVATADTTVRVFPREDIAASNEGAFDLLSAGQWHDIPMRRAETLLLAPTTGVLGGTEIAANESLLVVAGNACAYVPRGFKSCDHLEEVMLPLRTWGSYLVAAAPRSVAGEPSLLRVVSSADHNHVRFSTLTTAIELDRGESFELMTTDDTAITSDAPIFATQYLVGSTYFNRASATSDAPLLGDPAMGFVPPVAQFRREYTFVAPATYEANFVALVSYHEDVVRLDDVEVRAWSDVAGTDFRVARIEISSGTHRVASRLGVGVTMYAVAPFTSYLLPAGLNVELLQ
ncbi:MAG: IgGFc-binding protein [Sandaracinaceae bacterium]|nr:IgGFc-binding protein [Sandaracinaceae bacterium]